MSLSRVHVVVLKPHVADIAVDYVQVLALQWPCSLVLTEALCAGLWQSCKFDGRHMTSEAREVYCHSGQERTLLRSVTLSCSSCAPVSLCLRVNVIGLL